MDNEKFEDIVVVEESSEDFVEVAQQGKNLEAQEPELKGLGGWLILVGFGRVVSILQSIFMMFTLFIPFFTSGALEELASPISQAYSPLWIPVSYFELSGNLIVLGLHIALAVLFFMKKRLFPKLFIGTYAFLSVFSIIDALILEYIQSTMAYDLNLDTATTIITPLIVAAIWIPYMLKSVRVKNTFVQ